MAGVACARTLRQAGHRVTVFEREPGAGGRMASVSTPFGRFDSGAQYFTVRDPRFARALETSPRISRPWSANLVRVLDPHGRVAEAALPGLEQHWVAQPGMDALVRHWAEPLGDDLVTQTQVTRIVMRSTPAAGSCARPAPRMRSRSTRASMRCCWPYPRGVRVRCSTTAGSRLN